MTFRDERDALRAKAEALEAQLAGAQAALREREAELARLRAPAEVAEEPAETPPAPPTSPEPRRWWAWGLAGIASVSAAAWLFGHASCTGPMRGDETGSAPTTPSHVVEVTRHGVVRSEAGGRVATGAPCVVSVASNEDSVLSCHAVVRCGDVPLYGERSGTGFLGCTVAPDKTPLTGLDAARSTEDGDPELVLDLPHDQVDVRDADWEVRITLAPGADRVAR